MILENAVRAVGDNGPVYAETVSGRFPVEPFSMAGSLVFLALAVYLAWRTKLRIFRHPLLVSSIPLIAVTSVAMAFHHALRNGDEWRLVGFCGTVYLTIMVSAYFWYRITRAWLWSFLMIALSMGILVVLPLSGPVVPGDKVNGGLIYVVLAVNLAIPAMVHSVMHAYWQWKRLVMAGVLFALAVGFRQLDGIAGQILPCGTHCMWHLLGCAAAAVLALHVFDVDEARAKQRAEHSSKQRKAVSNQ